MKIKKRFHTTRVVVERSFEEFRFMRYIHVYIINELMIVTNIKHHSYVVIDWSFKLNQHYCWFLHTTWGALPLSHSKWSRVTQTCIRLHNVAIQEKNLSNQGRLMVKLFHGNPTQRAQDLRNQVASLFQTLNHLALEK